jgi:hypothetical protein
MIQLEDIDEIYRLKTSLGWVRKDLQELRDYHGSEVDLIRVLYLDTSQRECKSNIGIPRTLIRGALKDMESQLLQQLRSLGVDT